MELVKLKFLVIDEDLASVCYCRGCSDLTKQMVNWRDSEPEPYVQVVEP